MSPYQDSRLNVGAGCPTGPAMPAGRRFGLGGACTPSHAPHLQHLLSVYGERHGGGGPVAGRVSAGVSDARELSFGAWWFCDVGDQRDAELADRSLPANQ